MEIEFNTDNSVPTDTNEKVQSEGIYEITVDSPESPSTKPAARETNKEKDSLSIAFVAYPFKNVNPAEKVLQFIHTPSTPSQEPQSPKGLYACALDTSDSADSKTSIVSKTSIMEEVQDATKRKPKKVSTTMARLQQQQELESKTASHDAKSSFIFTVNSDEHKLKKKESQVKFTPVVSPVNDLDSTMTKKGKRIGKYRHEFMKLSEKLSWTSTTSLKSSSSTKSSKDYPMKFDPKRHPGSFSTVDRLSYR